VIYPSFFFSKTVAGVLVDARASDLGHFFFLWKIFFSFFTYFPLLLSYRTAAAFPPFPLNTFFFSLRLCPHPGGVISG